MMTALPKLFQQLTDADWALLRTRLTEMQSGDVESVMTSVGYVDVHAGDYDQEGRASAQSFDHEGKNLQHRSVDYCEWPTPIELAARAYRLAEREAVKAKDAMYACSPDSQIDHQKARIAERAARAHLDTLLGLPAEKAPT